MKSLALPRQFDSDSETQEILLMWSSPKLVPARVTREDEEPSTILDFFAVLKPARSSVKELQQPSDDDLWTLKNKDRKESESVLSSTPLSPTSSFSLTEKLNNLLNAESLNLQELRKLCWNGIPNNKLRASIWPILIGMVQPNDPDKRAAFVNKRKSEYLEQRQLTLAETKEETTWHQISIDMPRTHPGIPLYQKEATQQAMLRVLYVWSIRHPTTNYVQGFRLINLGMNDLLTPFFSIFLSNIVNEENVSDYDPINLTTEQMEELESLCYWCLTKLIERIQDHYTFSQPGIQRQIVNLKNLMVRVEPAIVKQLEAENVEFLQFGFRWMNCLLIREFHLNQIIRIWDTYLSEGKDAFSNFHLYVCAAYLQRYKDKIIKNDFVGIMTALQNSETMTGRDIESMLSQAFVWSSQFATSGHLQQQAQ